MGTTKERRFVKEARWLIEAGHPEKQVLLFIYQGLVVALQPLLTDHERGNATLPFSAGLKELRN